MAMLMLVRVLRFLMFFSSRVNTLAIKVLARYFRSRGLEQLAYILPQQQLADENNMQLMSIYRHIAIVIVIAIAIICWGFRAGGMYDALIE